VQPVRARDALLDQFLMPIGEQSQHAGRVIGCDDLQVLRPQPSNRDRVDICVVGLAAAAPTNSETIALRPSAPGDPAGLSDRCLAKTFSSRSITTIVLLSLCGSTPIITAPSLLLRR
jgi:hypothetical protein